MKVIRYPQVGSNEPRMRTALLSCLSMVRDAYLESDLRCSPSHGCAGNSEFSAAIATFVRGQLAILQWSIQQIERLASTRLKVEDM